MGIAEMIKGGITRFAEKALSSPPMGETAAATSKSLSGLKLMPYNPDDLVRSKAKGLKLYQEMTREPYIKAALHQKKARLLKIGWEIIPYSKSPRDVEIAAFVRWNLETRLAGAFTADLYAMLDGLNNGFSVMEKVYGVEKSGRWKGKVVIDDIKSKDPSYFDFETDEYGNLGSSGLVLNQSMGGRKNLRVDKFVLFSYLSRYENHYGDSDLRAAYRAFWLKDTAWKLRAVYMERYSGNNLKGTYPKNDEKAKDKLIEIFKAWQQETGIALPEGVDVEVMNLATSSKSEYESTINDCNREIQIGILGQTLTMDVGQKGTGSRALGEVHDGVRDDFVWFLDETLAAEINLQIIRSLIDYNFDTDVYPWWTFKSREGFDTEEFSRTLLNLGKVKNLNIPVWWVKEKYRIPEPDPGEEVIDVAADTAPNLWGANLQHPPASSKLSEPPASPSVIAGEAGQSRGPYWRELNRFELFSELPRIDAETTALVQEGVKAASPVYDSMKADVLARVEKKRVFERKDYDTIENISVNIGGLKKLLADTIIKAHLMARIDVMRLASKPAKLSEENPDDYTPEEAIAALGLKAGLTPEEFNRLSMGLKSTAFTVAGMEKNTIDREIKLLLLQSLKNGDDFDAFKFRLSEAFIKYAMPVYGDVTAIGKAILPHHAEVVFRTNVMDAYNQGRKAALKEPDVAESFPAWQYSAVLDGRTRPAHAAMDGKVFMADDPVWKRITPPSGYNCRCTIVPVNRYDFTRDMLASATEIPGDFPDPGFG